MRTIILYQKIFKRAKLRNYTTSEEVNGNLRTVSRYVVAGGFISALAFYFITKEIKPNSMEKEVDQEPLRVSFNDDFVGAFDQKSMLYKQEPKIFMDAQRLIDFHKIIKQEEQLVKEQLSSKFKLPKITIPRPDFEVIKTMTKTARASFLSLFETILPESIYNYKESEVYERYKETRIEFREMIQEAKNEIRNFKESWSHKKDFTIPKMLLPPPLPYGQPVITVLIDDNILYNNTIIRSGGETFIKKISQFTETVWNSGSSYMEYTVPPPLFVSYNPPIIHHRLFAESWTSMPMRPVQMDLPRLNRDLSKVLVLSTRKELYQYYPENVLIIPEKFWWTDDKDVDLYDLIPVIKHIADEVKSGKDIRDVLKYYEDIDPAKLTKIAMEKSTVQQQRKSESQKKIQK